MVWSHTSDSLFFAVCQRKLWSLTSNVLICYDAQFDPVFPAVLTLRLFHLHFNFSLSLLINLGRKTIPSYFSATFFSLKPSLLFFFNFVKVIFSSSYLFLMFLHSFRWFWLIILLFLYCSCFSMHVRFIPLFLLFIVNLSPWLGF